MKWHCILMTSLAVLLAADAATAADRVRKKDKETVFGVISAMNNLEVVVVDRSIRTKIPVGQIKAIYYDGEPESLSRARAEIAQGRYEDAQTTLAKIDTSQIARKMIVADVEFYRALAAARLALGGKGEIRQAGTQMWQFVGSHRDNYHWFEANRVAGDLLMASRQYALAIRSYQTLAETPWFDYRLHAALGAGRAQLADGKTDDALASFTSAIDMKPDNPKELDAAAVRQKKLAQVGRARCLAAKGEQGEAIRELRDILDHANPEDAVLCGDAYNALGNALRKAGKPQDAILALLHVDILYFANSDCHAEALANLAELWHEVHHTDRAIQAQELLRTRYPNSRWTPQ